MAATKSIVQSGIKSDTVSRVIIVDDHELLRDGLLELLGDEPQLKVCGEAAGEAQAMTIIRKEKPNLVIVDVALAQGNGINLVKRIKAHDESIRSIMSDRETTGFAMRSLKKTRGN